MLKKAFVDHIIGLESLIQVIKSDKVEGKARAYGDGWTWEEFEQFLLPKLQMHLPIALDRMDFHKTLINELEFQHKFTIDSLEQLWNMYRPTLDKLVTESKLRTAAAFSAQSPKLVTEQQFKLILQDAFKVRDA